MSVQEETYGTGAKTGAYQIDADEAIAVDVSFASQPDVSGQYAGVELAKGPMICISPILSKAMSDKLISVAKKKNIPFQYEPISGTTGTNADHISVTKAVLLLPLFRFRKDICILRLKLLIFLMWKIRQLCLLNILSAEVLLMTDFKLLEKLCTVEGISGDEGSVREIIINEIKPFADEIKTDNLGNIIVFKKGKNRAKAKLMLSAHMDEVGFMVTDITSDGYLKFDEVGGLDRRVVLGKTVTVGKNKVNGVIGVKPIHLSKSDERTAVPKYGEMYIDIGATSKDDALSVVSYGDSVNFNLYTKITAIQSNQRLLTTALAVLRLLSL